MIANSNKILFAYVSIEGYSLADRKEYILSRPQFDKYYDKSFFEDTIEKKKTEGDFLYTIGNVGGEFIAQNISTTSKVIHENITIDILKKEIEDFRPTHIGFSITLSAYELFKECALFVRKNYPNIKILAGDVGALVPETKNYADYVCRGEGTQFVRNILGENLDHGFRIPRTTVTRYRPNPLNPKHLMPNKVGILTTDLGCGIGCDFCITYALYRMNYVIGNELEIKKALLDMAEMIESETKSNDINIILTDPMGLRDEKIWSNLIDLMKGENYFFHFNVLTSSSLLNRYSKKGGLLDKFQKSEEMEISLVEIGLETINPVYKKNIGIDWKEHIRMLKDRGIIPILTIIIGYDFQDRRTALKDVDEAISFDPSILLALNLRVLYETKLWYKYLQENRLLDVPPEFRMLWGYQAFLHPHFKPRFEDCLPLMMEIDDMIYSRIGSIYENSLDIIKKRKRTPYNEKLIKIGEILSKLQKGKDKI